MLKLLCAAALVNETMRKPDLSVMSHIHMDIHMHNPPSAKSVTRGVYAGQGYAGLVVELAGGRAAAEQRAY